MSSTTVKLFLRAILIIVAAASLFGCGNNQEALQGRVVKMDYSDADIESGDWVRIDSFTFTHIGRREEAQSFEFPVPSSSVLVDSVEGRPLRRDYNSKTIAMHIVSRLDEINKTLPDEKKFEIKNYFELSYNGIITLTKRDSSKMSVSHSPSYGPDIEAHND